MKAVITLEVDVLDTANAFRNIQESVRRINEMGDSFNFPGLYGKVRLVGIALKEES